MKLVEYVVIFVMECKDKYLFLRHYVVFVLTLMVDSIINYSQFQLIIYFLTIQTTTMNIWEWLSPLTWMSQEDIDKVAEALYKLNKDQEAQKLGLEEDAKNISGNAEFHERNKDFPDTVCSIMSYDRAAIILSTLLQHSDDVLIFDDTLRDDIVNDKKISSFTYEKRDWLFWEYEKIIKTITSSKEELTKFFNSDNKLTIVINNKSKEEDRDAVIYYKALARLSKKRQREEFRPKFAQKFINILQKPFFQKNFSSRAQGHREALEKVFPEYTLHRSVIIKLASPELQAELKEHFGDKIFWAIWDGHKYMLWSHEDKLWKSFDKPEFWYSFNMRNTSQRLLDIFNAHIDTCEDYFKPDELELKRE